MRVAVVGGGISGMSAAKTLRDGGADVTLFEASGRAGGMLRTERVDGYVIERGPDSIISSKPAAIELAEDLGLGSRIVRTEGQARGAYVVASGRLQRIPDGFQLVAPANIPALARSGILSPKGLLRAAMEPFIPKKVMADESLASFVRRRFGQEVLDRLAQPMAGGIYGADPELLSLRATMPRFLDLEAEKGSLTLALAKQARAGAAKASGARYGLFISFDQGIGFLAETLAEHLGDTIRLNTAVSPIEGEGTQYRVAGECFDGVVVATTAWKAAALLPPELSEARARLEAIHFGSGAIVTFAFDRSDVPMELDAAGFVVPAIEGRPVMASTWSSVKWPGRAPDGKLLLRAFLGGYAWPEVVGWEDDALIAAARRGFADLMGIRAEPELVRVDRWQRVMPRLHLGHIERMDALDAAMAKAPRMALAGNAYRGVGIPDSVRSGQQAATRVLAALAG